MTYWERQVSVFILGGLDVLRRLNEVQQFMISKNEWKALPSLPEDVSHSSATVLRDVLYNIGGSGSANSVHWLDLLSGKGKWNSVKTLGLTDFLDLWLREATVVMNKIVYFGG